MNIILPYSFLGRAYGCLLSSVRTGGTLHEERAGSKIDHRQGDAHKSDERAEELEEFDEVLVHAA